ncbi:DUF4268 domain-containing protein [Tropicimonas sp. IMCC34011]|uniref:DUF4268 domain-containing protein n=1 Tax=Tropicimonas sp. IMCC34011 TaxID=2248759 RepID=UPI000E250372|nr:DUF4268 domain-containing protein [Tropicimonas sp. IMCC34011]
MSGLPLDHLKRLSPREAWSKEATDFTPWLAREENFAVLAGALHFMDAEVEGTEHAVGDFSADIIARDRDGYILVENQLEQTDHTHLGQILTYLAGLDGPVKVVWISTKVREEHRAAIDWLNGHTPDDFSFFAVELELFKIGSSPAAPHFYVVAKPNEWSRHVSKRAQAFSGTAINSAQQQYRDYWGAFSDYLSESDAGFAISTPSKRMWQTFSIGRSGYKLSTLASARDRWLGVEIYIDNDPEKLVFDHLHGLMPEIEKSFGGDLTWERLDSGKASRIVVRQHQTDPMDQSRWTEYFEWYLDHMKRLRIAFSNHIRNIDLSDLKRRAETVRSEQASGS